MRIDANDVFEALKVYLQRLAGEASASSPLEAETLRGETLAAKMRYENVLVGYMVGVGSIRDPSERRFAEPHGAPSR